MEPIRSKVKFIPEQSRAVAGIIRVLFSRFRPDYQFRMPVFEFYEKAVDFFVKILIVLRFQHPAHRRAIQAVYIEIYLVDMHEIVFYFGP